MFSKKTEDWPLNTVVDHSHPHSHADSACDTGWDLSSLENEISINKVGPSLDHFRDQIQGVALIFSSQHSGLTKITIWTLSLVYLGEGLTKKNPIRGPSFCYFFFNPFLTLPLTTCLPVCSFEAQSSLSRHLSSHLLLGYTDYTDWSGTAGGVCYIFLFPIYLYVILYEILLLLYYINLTNTTPKRAYKADKVFLLHCFLNQKFLKNVKFRYFVDFFCLFVTWPEIPHWPITAPPHPTPLYSIFVDANVTPLVSLESPKKGICSDQWSQV